MGNTAERGGAGAKRGKRRQFTGGMAYLITALTVLLACFHLYTAFMGLLPALQQRSFHLSFVLCLVFLLYPARDGSVAHRPSALDFVLAAASFGCAMYLCVMYENIALRMGDMEQYEIILGGALVVLVFEAARRVLGNILPVFCALFLVYAYFGPSMPGPFLHPGYSVPRIIEELYLTNDGLFGIVLGVSATYIFMFVLFGAFLTTSGTANFFNEFSMAAAGHLKGGPAKIAVISSALMGTISGSTAANVATTGAFTIPLMKKVGYPAHFAGAVEATASTGGQFMPPVLGAAAFILADTVGTPYVNVIKASLVPALLYFFGIWSSLSVEAARLNLIGLSRSELPNIITVLRTSGYKALPLFAIIVVLCMGRNPLFASCFGIIACLIVTAVGERQNMNIKTLLATLESGAKGALPVAVACTIVGVVIGVMGLTGVALRIGDIIIDYTAGNLTLTLLVTMFISLFLGMGMPTSASYVMTSVVAVPALAKLGCNLLDAHFFCFFFAVLSSVTPPVCIGAYTAAGIAGAPPNKTAFTAVRLALPGFLVPFVFMYSPELLLTNTKDWLSFALMFASGLAGIATLSIGLEGFLHARLRIPERVVLCAAALCMIIPGIVTDSVGFGILAVVYCIAKKRALGTGSPAVTAPEPAPDPLD